MNERIEELNKLVCEHVGKHNRADEKLFELGVELGKELEKLGTQKYRLPFFESQSQSISVQEAKRDPIRQLSEKVRNLVTKAVRAHIEDNGSLTFSANHYSSGGEKLDDNIGKRHGIKHLRTSQTQVGGDLTLHFEFVGKLCEYFTNCNVSQQFQVSLDNSASGEDSVTVYEVSEKGFPFYNASCGLDSIAERQSLEFIKAFCEDFDKHLTKHYLSVK